MNYIYISAREIEYNVSLSKKYLTTNSYKVNVHLKNKLKDSYIDIFNYEETPKVVNDMPYMSARHHLTKYGAQLATSKMLTNESFTKQLK